MGDFPIFQYGTLAGQFDEILIRGISPGNSSIDFGSGTDDVITLTTIPEPSTLALLGMGVVALLAYRLRKRTSRT